MNDVFYLGTGRDEFLSLREPCMVYLSRVKTLWMEDKGNRVYQVFEWQSYLKLLNEIKDKFPAMQPAVDSIIECVPVFEQDKDTFLIMDSTARVLKSNIAELAGLLQGNINVCDAIRLGDYSLWAKVSSQPKESLFDCYKRLEAAITESPFMKNMEIHVDQTLLSFNKASSRIAIYINSNETVKALQDLGKLYEKATKLKWYTDFLEEMRFTLLKYLSRYKLNRQDSIDSLDLIDDSIMDKLISELEEEIMPLETQEERLQAQRSLQELCKLQKDRSMQLCLDVVCC